MRKFSLLALAMLAAGGLALNAQDKRYYESGSQRNEVEYGHWYVSLAAGPMYNYYENAFVYKDNGEGGKLFTHQAALAVGYNFSSAFGVRLSAEVGKNAGAANKLQTSSRGYYPYVFTNVSLFADAILDLKGMAGKTGPFRPKLYAGIGGGDTFGFTQSHHPWQKINPSNLALGLRGGFIGEYVWDSGIGIFADLCAEGYTDTYNGLWPNKHDKEIENGYPGFPLDLRATAFFGLTYHF